MTPTGRRDKGAALPKALAAMDSALGATLRVVAIACLAALMVLLLANVVSRSMQWWSLAWLDEVVQGLFAWLVFTGTAALWRANQHFRVEWLEQRFQGRSRAALQMLITTLSLVFLVVMTWKGIDLTLRSRALTPILDLPTAWLYAAIPVCGAIMTLYSAGDLLRQAKILASPSNRTEESPPP